MGQTLRRAAGKAKNTAFKPPPPPPPPQTRVRNAAEREAGTQDRLGAAPNADSADGLSKVRNESNVLEEQDPEYDAMLGKMVGRITSKPGGKLEMGEAFIVEKYNRPLPKLRSSRDEGGPAGPKPTPPGTIDIQQLRQIFLLYEGKSEEHQGAMNVEEIATKFRLETFQVKKILQFASLPKEDVSSQKKPKEEVNENSEK